MGLKYPRARIAGEGEKVGMVATLRKGLKFVLMSMGISSPEKKAPGAQRPPRDPRG